MADYTRLEEIDFSKPVMVSTPPFSLIRCSSHLQIAKIPTKHSLFKKELRKFL
jgi:hypothetical protein